MRISAIIPAYNEPIGAVEATIASVRHAIVVDGGVHEVLVIDDGSSRPLPAIACPWTSVYRIGHRGIAAAINEGVRRATGDYVMPVAVGDRCRPERFRYCSEALEGTPAIFHGWANELGARPVVHNWRSRLAVDNQFSLGAALWRRDLGLEWDESLTYCSDWDFAARVEYEGPGWEYLPLVLSECFEHATGHTRSATGEKRAQRDRDRALVARRWRRIGAQKAVERRQAC